MIVLWMTAGGHGSAWWFGHFEGSVVTYVTYTPIEQGADVNMQPWKDHGGAEAARESKEPERGRIDYKCSGNALIEAIRYDDYGIVKYLIENRADVNLVVESGLYCSALQTAVGGYELYLVQMPIKFDLNRNQLDFLELLIENGVNVNLPFKTGRCGSALAVAAFKGRRETVETLPNMGAISSLALNHGDYATALDAAIAGKEEAKKK
ncbi:hypothetical protein TCE0_039r13054 [Talaromyces pinophilus]|uniref:Uncharacterized protein n=1 Tax=Talaromyces pinophilus TaxID=128442 RepID=A0A6N4SLJ0_TALPI|nr:hypothetical protein TCE0_039r13054 [Talaromyces pinophilus]